MAADTFPESEQPTIIEQLRNWWNRRKESTPPANPIQEAPLDGILKNLNHLDPEEREKTTAAIEKLKGVAESLMKDGGIIFDNGLYFKGPLTNPESIKQIRFRDLGGPLARQTKEKGIIRFDKNQAAAFSAGYGFDLISCLNLLKQDENIAQELGGTGFTIVDSNIRSANIDSTRFEQALIEPFVGVLNSEYRHQGMKPILDNHVVAAAALKQAMVRPPSP